jgi:hypothetical protein
MHYATAENIFRCCLGNTLMVLEIPEEAQQTHYLYVSKSDRINVIKFLPLLEIKTIQMILESGEQIKGLDVLFKHAVRKDSVHVVQWLHKNIPDLNVEYEEMLRIATATGSINTVKYLCRSGISPDIGDRTARTIAYELGRDEIAKYFNSLSQCKCICSQKNDASYSAID